MPKIKRGSQQAKKSLQVCNVSFSNNSRHQPLTCRFKCNAEMQELKKQFYRCLGKTVKIATILGLILFKSTYIMRENNSLYIIILSKKITKYCSVLPHSENNSTPHEYSADFLLICVQFSRVSKFRKNFLIPINICNISPL